MCSSDLGVVKRPVRRVGEVIGIVEKIVGVKVEQIGVKLKEVTEATLKEVKDIFDGITEITAIQKLLCYLFSVFLIVD